jgi:hypothetical protein
MEDVKIISCIPRNTMRRFRTYEKFWCSSTTCNLDVTSFPDDAFSPSPFFNASTSKSAAFNPSLASCGTLSSVNNSLSSAVGFASAALALSMDISILWRGIRSFVGRRVYSARKAGSYRLYGVPFELMTRMLANCCFMFSPLNLNDLNHDARWPSRRYDVGGRRWTK